MTISVKYYDPSSSTLRQKKYLVVQKLSKPQKDERLTIHVECGVQTYSIVSLQ